MSRTPFLCDRNYQYVNATGSSAGTSPEVRGPVVAIVGGSGGFGIVLPSAASVPSGYTVFIYNSSGSSVTIYVKGIDTVNGVTTVTLNTDRGAIFSVVSGKGFWFGGNNAGIGFP